MSDDIFDKVFGDSVQIDVCESKYIKSCHKCDGTGYVSHEELVDYHKRDYATITNRCSLCKGEGRLTATDTIVTVHTKYSSGIYSVSEKATKYVSYDDDKIDPSKNNSKTYTKRLAIE